MALVDVSIDGAAFPNHGSDCGGQVPGSTLLIAVQRAPSYSQGFGQTLLAQSYSFPSMWNGEVEAAMWKRRRPCQPVAPNLTGHSPLAATLRLAST